jgi:hypothetical protein
MQSSVEVAVAAVDAAAAVAAAGGIGNVQQQVQATGCWLVE